MRAACGETSEFPMTIGLYQGSTLTPSLFALIMDELTTHIQEEVSWCMLFVVDIVLVNESRDDVNAKLERWQEALESKGFKISSIKTGYMNCNFSGHIQRAEISLELKPMRYH